MKKAAIAVFLVFAVLAFGACGGGGSSTSSAAKETSGGGTSAEAGGEGEGKVQAEAEEPAAESGNAEEGIVLIEANPKGRLAFEESHVTAAAGPETITMINQSKVPHNVTVEDSSGKILSETNTVAAGTSGFTADLKPGTYTFFCSVPGHREAGMEGTLTVK